MSRATIRPFRTSYRTSSSSSSSANFFWSCHVSLSDLRLHSPFYRRAIFFLRWLNERSRQSLTHYHWRRELIGIIKLPARFYLHQSRVTSHIERSPSSMKERWIDTVSDSDWDWLFRYCNYHYYSNYRKNLTTREESKDI